MKLFIFCPIKNSKNRKKSIQMCFNETTPCTSLICHKLIYWKIQIHHLFIPSSLLLMQRAKISQTVDWRTSLYLSCMKRGVNQRLLKKKQKKMQFTFWRQLLYFLSELVIHIITHVVLYIKLKLWFWQFENYCHIF